MIYLDNAATTRVYDVANKVLCDTNADFYFNASALYGKAAEAERRLTAARKTLSDMLRADDGEIYFTSGGTESDNTALFCSRKQKGGRIIVGEGEHDAVINPAKQLQQKGFDVVFAPIKKDGAVDVDKFADLLTPDVSLVSVMHVSNETGAVNDIAKLVAMTKRIAPKALFHSDGVQAFCKIPVNLRALGVDMYSLSGHKIHGPKGIGALYVKKGASVHPLLYGGGQEKGFRSGTENTPLVFSFVSAAEQYMSACAENNSKKRGLIEYLERLLTDNIANSVTITDLSNCAPHILTVAFDGVRGEVVSHELEKSDILVGIGSACSSHRESRFKKLLGLDAPMRKTPRTPLSIEETGDDSTDSVEFTLPSEMHDTRLCELEFPPDALILLIRRDEKFIVPRGETKLKSGDILTVMGNKATIEQIRHILTSNT